MVRTRVAAIAFAMSMVVAAAGCGGDSGASGQDPSPSLSPTASPTVSATPPATEAATPEPRPTPPRPVDSTTGRKAFANHVVESWGYALRTNDPLPLLELSPKGIACDGCRQLASELRSRKAAGWYVDFPGAQIRKVEVRTAGSTSVATMLVAIPESDSYHDDGSYRSTSPAHAKGTFEVEMRFTTQPRRCTKAGGCTPRPTRGFELVAFRVG